MTDHIVSLKFLTEGGVVVGEHVFGPYGQLDANDVKVDVGNWFASERPRWEGGMAGEMCIFTNGKIVAHIEVFPDVSKDLPVEGLISRSKWGECLMAAKAAITSPR